MQMGLFARVQHMMKNVKKRMAETKKREKLVFIKKTVRQLKQLQTYTTLNPVRVGGSCTVNYLSNLISNPGDMHDVIFGYLGLRVW